MEHREIPRIVPAEGRPRDARAEPAAHGRRFARFVNSPHERRLVISRLGLAVLASVLALIAAGMIGSQVLEMMVQWLHVRPQYRTTFGAIELEPPPPAWYRGGNLVFLDRVRESAKRGDEPFSYLDISLAELDREFRLYRWVKRVRYVRRRTPNRILVGLDYRRPVATASVPGRAGRWLLDEDGVILPDEDVDRESAGLLIRITVIDPPFGPRAGHVWMSRETSEGLGKADERVLAASRLAGFLTSALDREPGPIPPALRPVAIHLDVENFTFVENAEKTMISWAEPPGLEPPGDRTAEQKWTDLHDWLKRRPAPPVLDPYYLDFSKDGIVIKKVSGRD